MKINPYQPPETSIVEKTVAPPRPILVFIAAAVCCGVAAPLLLMAVLGGTGIVSRIITDGWAEAVLSPPPYARIFVPVTSFSVFCGLAFLGAGVSFLKRRWRRGGWFLGAALIIGGAFVIFLSLYD